MPIDKHTAANDARSARLAIPMPKTMRSLPVDHRGYPVPFMAMKDATGKPMFAINDDRKTVKCFTKRLCSICGRRRDEDWFVGGIRCFTHPLGAFLDPPAHRACAEYALRVCPFIANPSYGRRIDGKIAERAALPAGMGIAVEPSLPDRPEFFALGRAIGIHVERPSAALIWRADRWLFIQKWKHGKPVETVLDLRSDVERRAAP